jgi:hypothetical protein
MKSSSAIVAAVIAITSLGIVGCGADAPSASSSSANSSSMNSQSERQILGDAQLKKLEADARADFATRRPTTTISQPAGITSNSSANSVVSPTAAAGSGNNIGMIALALGIAFGKDIVEGGKELLKPSPDVKNSTPKRPDSVTATGSPSGAAPKPEGSISRSTSALASKLPLENCSQPDAISIFDKEWALIQKKVEGEKS